MDATTTVHQGRALWLSTIAFTVCFAVWTIFSIIGIRIKQELGSQRDAVRPAGRHADPDRIADPARARHLDRPIWRPARLHASTMLAAAVATFLLTYAHTYPAVPARGARRRHRRRLVRGRRRLCLALVSGGEAGHRARHLRRRQCRRGGHQVPRALRARRLRLADGRAGLGGRHRV